MNATEAPATAGAAVTSAWPCCSHCSCEVRRGHEVPCGQVGCRAHRPRPTRLSAPGD